MYPVNFFLCAFLFLFSSYLFSGVTTHSHPFLTSPVFYNNFFYGYDSETSLRKLTISGQDESSISDFFNTEFPLEIHFGVLFAVSKEGHLIAYDAQLHRELWRFQRSSVQQFFVFYSGIYLLTNTGNVVCLSFSTGREKWTYSQKKTNSMFPVGESPFMILEHSDTYRLLDLSQGQIVRDLDALQKPSVFLTSWNRGFAFRVDNTVSTFFLYPSKVETLSNFPKGYKGYYRENCFIYTYEQSVSSFDLEMQETLWRWDSSADISSAYFSDTSIFIYDSLGRMYSISYETGEENYHIDVDISGDISDIIDSADHSILIKDKTFIVIDKENKESD